MSHSQVITHFNRSAGDPDDSTCARLDLSSPSPSRVRVLDLSGYYLPSPLSLTQFNHLKVLRMASVDRHFAPGITEWTTILWLLPELEALDLDFAVGDHFAGVNEPVQGALPITCKSLRYLKLTLESELCDLLLSRINVPNLDNLELDIRCNSTAFNPARIDHVIREIARLFQKRANQSQRPLEYHELYLGLTNRLTSLATHPPETISQPSEMLARPPSFSVLIRENFWIQSTALQSPLLLLLDIFNSIPISNDHVRSMSIKLLLPHTLCDYHLHFLQPIFASLAFVETLSINTDGTKTLRQFLDSSLSCPPDLPHQMLPQLKELAITAKLVDERDTRTSMMSVIDEFIVKREQGGCPVVKQSHWIVQTEVLQGVKDSMIEKEAVGCFGAWWAQARAFGMYVVRRMSGIKWKRNGSFSEKSIL